MCAGGTFDFGKSLFDGHGRFVAALRDQGVKDVCNRHNARGKRDIVLGETFHIAASIPFFVMIGSHVRSDLDIIRFLDRAEYFPHDPAAGRGMLFDRFKFLRGEPARLLEDVVGDDDLADVVHRSGFCQKLDITIGQKIGIQAPFFEGAGEKVHIKARALNMFAGIPVPALDEVCHADDDIILQR